MALLQHMQPRAGRLVACLLLLLACACRAELHQNLDEKQANEIIVVLGSEDIRADKKSAGEGAWTVLVPKAQYQRALSVLAAYNLPRSRESVESLAEPGPFASAGEERTRQTRVITSGLENTFMAMDGIVDAHVHAYVPEPARSRFRAEESADPGASVVLVHRMGVEPPSETAVRAVLQGAIEGLRADAISTVFVATRVPEPKPAESVVVGPFVVARESAATLRVTLLAMAGLCAVLASALIVSSLRRTGRDEESA